MRTHLKKKILMGPYWLYEVVKQLRSRLFIFYFFYLTKYILKMFFFPIFSLKFSIYPTLSKKTLIYVFPYSKKKKKKISPPTPNDIVLVDYV